MLGQSSPPATTLSLRGNTREGREGGHVSRTYVLQTPYESVKSGIFDLRTITSVRERND